VTARHAYDAARHPPAPVLPARVGRPGQDPAVLLVFLVDTGADITVVPDAVARELRLPAVSQIAVRGIAGAIRSARVYAAEVEAGGGRSLVEVVGMGEEALIGRDLLNRWTVTLHGPRRVMDVVINAGA
jgi:predicted aspartyl protease